MIASALSLNASAAKNGLPAIVAKELAAAKAAGLDELIEAMQPKQAAAEKMSRLPPSRPTKRSTASTLR
ncbi:MAG: hypothetical protein ACLUEQ_00105 [Cloacibacillus evryensis]